MMNFEFDVSSTLNDEGTILVTPVGKYVNAASQ